MNIDPRIVTFSWTENDWLQAQRQATFYGRGTYLYIKSIIYWAITILTCQFIWNGMAGTLPAPQSILETQIVSLIFYAPLIGIIMLRRRMKRVTACKQTYRKAPEIFVDHSVEIDDNGLTWRQQQNRHTMPWKLMRAVFLTRDSLVIVTEDHFANILPRQIFLDGGKVWYDAISEHIKVSQGGAKSP